MEGGVSLSDSWVVLQEVDDGGGNWDVDVTLERLGGGGDSLLLCFSFLACCLSLFFCLGMADDHQQLVKLRGEYWRGRASIWW